MLIDYIQQQIRKEFSYEPTEQQIQLIGRLAEFLMDKTQGKLFVLKGYAGTGKTTIVSALVRAMHNLKQKTVLLAPTGRAAKVLSGYSGYPAFTIHKKIYRQKAMGEATFQLADNLHTDTLFIVDEASMISNIGNDSIFGSGYLLDDLIKYAYNGVNCSILLLGDTAQLPPVFQEYSPALDKNKLKSYGLKVSTFTLTEVVRQAMESGILLNATCLRQALEENNTSVMPRFQLGELKDIQALNGMDLVDEVQQAYSGVGLEDTIVITRSNKMANIYNNGIRARVMMKEEEISNGDLLMITRNNYFWNKSYKEIDFIANGDVVEVIRINGFVEMYGFRFIDMTLRSLDFQWEIDARVWLESLQSENPKQMADLSQDLFKLVSEDYQYIGNKRERMTQLFNNEYLNALQVKFSYAVTCHKAQGVNGSVFLLIWECDQMPKSIVVITAGFILL